LNNSKLSQEMLKSLLLLQYGVKCDAYVLPNEGKQELTSKNSMIWWVD
jgi:hypothetical protein